jgi:hypothetical protein
VVRSLAALHFGDSFDTTSGVTEVRSLAALRDDKVAGRVGAKKRRKKGGGCAAYFFSRFFCPPPSKVALSFRSEARNLSSLNQQPLVSLPLLFSMEWWHAIPQRSKESVLLASITTRVPSTAFHCDVVSLGSEARNLSSLHREPIVALPMLFTVERRHVIPDRSKESDLFLQRGLLVQFWNAFFTTIFNE